MLILRIKFQRGDTPPQARLALVVAISGWGGLRSNHDECVHRHTHTHTHTHARTHAPPLSSAELAPTPGPQAGLPPALSLLAPRVSPSREGPGQPAPTLARQRWEPDLGMWTGQRRAHLAHLLPDTRLGRCTDPHPLPLPPLLPPSLFPTPFCLCLSSAPLSSSSVCVSLSLLFFSSSSSASPYLPLKPLIFVFLSLCLSPYFSFPPLPSSCLP